VQREGAQVVAGKYPQKVFGCSIRLGKSCFRCLPQGEEFDVEEEEEEEESEEEGGAPGPVVPVLHSRVGAPGPVPPSGGPAGVPPPAAQLLQQAQQEQEQEQDPELDSLDVDLDFTTLAEVRARF
jgi:hypothetical protein